MVANVNGIAVCVENPCGASSESLPHESTIKEQFNISSEEPLEPKNIPCHDVSDVQSNDCIIEKHTMYYDEYKYFEFMCKEEGEKVYCTEN